MPLSVDEIVNQRVEAWERRCQQAREVSQRKEQQGPMITISRGSGSLGRQIGELTANQLGFEFYDKQLVEAISKEAHVRKRVVEALDEKTQGVIAGWIDSFGSQKSLGEHKYLEHLGSVLLALAQEGSAVILGRGAHHILDPRHTLRVRIVAPLQQRKAAYASLKKLSQQQAEAEILRIDAERSAYIQHHFDSDVSDVLQYDMILNAGLLSPSDCAALICHAYEQRFKTQN